LCSTDITIDFVGLMFKRQQKESPYGKSEKVTDGFHKTDVCWTAVVKEMP